MRVSYKRITNEFLEKRFKELLYHFGEVDWDILKNKAWEKYINKDVKFTKKQIESLRLFIEGFLEDIEENEKDLRKPLRKAAFKYAFESNTKFSNNDGSAGDNYGSFLKGANYVIEKMKKN